MVNVVNKARVILTMDTEKNPKIQCTSETDLRSMNVGHHLPLGKPKDYSISATCQNSAWQTEFCFDSGDEDDRSSVEEVENDSSEEEDELDFSYPKRSRALKMLSEDFRILLKEEKMTSISEEDAKKCLSKKRFKFVEETHPIPESFFIVRSRGFLILQWLTQGPRDEWLVDEQTREILKTVAGPVRDQGVHLICWAYVHCDLLSAARVLNGLDKEFVPLSPMFLCRNIRPELYRENCEAKNFHCCFGMDMESGLIYTKLYGVPKERPDEVVIDCTISENFNVGEEELYKVKEIYHYDTLDLALQRLKKGHPIGAVLMLFDGWGDYYSLETDPDWKNIYEGPKQGKRYEEEHAVIIIDYRILNGKKVAICKLSNGPKVGYGGYIAVSLEIMVSMVGACEKHQSTECDYKPQYLLRDFYSVDVEMGPDPLVTVEPNEAESHEKFKVDISMVSHDLPSPIYRSPASASTGLMMNAASKQFKTIQNEYEMTVDESSEGEEARDGNFVPTDSNRNPEHFLTNNPF